LQSRSKDRGEHHCRSPNIFVSVRVLLVCMANLWLRSSSSESTLALAYGLDLEARSDRPQFAHSASKLRPATKARPRSGFRDWPHGRRIHSRTPVCGVCMRVFFPVRSTGAWGQTHVRNTSVRKHLPPSRGPVAKAQGERRGCEFTIDSLFWSVLPHTEAHGSSDGAQVGRNEPH
jgi:hypothetical protein